MRPDCQRHEKTLADPNCHQCKRWLEILEGDLDKVNEHAQDLGAELAREGVDLPRDVMRDIRIEAFIDLMLNGDERGRLVFEVECGRRTVLALSEGLKNIRNQRDGLKVPEAKLHVVRNQD